MAKRKPVKEVEKLPTKIGVWAQNEEDDDSGLPGHWNQYDSIEEAVAECEGEDGIELFELVPKSLGRFKMKAVKQ